MTCYSIPDLLKLLKKEGGERVRVEAGYSPVLIVSGESHEIEGPVVMEDEIEEMLRGVVKTRDMRAFRRKSTLDVIVWSDGAEFLVRVTRAFGECWLEALPVVR